MKFQAIFAGKFAYKLIKVFLFFPGLKRNFFLRKTEIYLLNYNN